MALFILPGTDIHLIPGSPVLTQLFGVPKNTGDWTDIGTSALTLVQPPRIVPPNAPGVVTFLFGTGRSIEMIPHPNLRGTVFVEIHLNVFQTSTHAGDNEVFSGLIRVTVHDAVRSFWPGNNRITIFKDESNYVITVYAEFTDGLVGDISGHPYVTYRPRAGTPGEVNVSADGRLTAVRRGDTSVDITVQNIAAVQNVPIHVEEVLSSRPAPASFSIHSRNNGRRVIFLAEGYDSRARFEDHAKNITDRMLRGPSHSPYRLLKDSFDVHGVFDPTQEARITQGPAVVPGVINGANGQFDLLTFPFPLDDSAIGTIGLAAVPALAVPANLHFTQTRDSRYGLIYGSRFGGMRTNKPNVNISPEHAWLEIVQAHRAHSFDWRRSGNLSNDPRQLQRSFLTRYLDHLAIPDASQPETIVIFLIDDHYRGGTQGFGFDGLRIDKDNHVSATAGLEPQFRNVQNGLVVDHAPNQVNFDLEPVTAIVSHEFAHFFNLGDEYEGDARPIGNLIANQPEIEKFENLHSHLTIINNPPALRASDLKWNWHRIEMLSIAAGVSGQQGRIVVDLDANEALKWEVDDPAFLRTVYRSVRPLVGPRLSESPLLNVVERNPTTIVLATTQPFQIALFGPGSLLYQPVQYPDGVARRLIEREVLGYLQGKVPGYFDRSNVPGSVTPPVSCADQVQQHQFPDDPIPGFSPPLDNADVIGVYEGGHGHNCTVFRPSGFCKMRTSYVFANNRVVSFCFVCKYVLVDRIDPTQHPKLDREYPQV